jgi:hypothetical protein
VKGLKDIDEIDMILDITPHAKVTLVLVDGELWPDEESRLKQYLIKLECYIAYVMSDQFKKDHPGVRPDQVLIAGMCQFPPTEAMKIVTHVRSKANPESRFEYVADIISRVGSCRGSCGRMESGLRIDPGTIWEGEAPAEPKLFRNTRLGRSSPYHYRVRTVNALSTQPVGLLHAPEENCSRHRSVLRHRACIFHPPPCQAPEQRRSRRPADQVSTSSSATAFASGGDEDIQDCAWFSG